MMIGKAERTFGLTNNQLKIIAMISMLFDHVGLMLFPQVGAFRIVGRLAFPIFAYMIAEGCRYTRNRARYLLMIAVMALLFQAVYFVTMQSAGLALYQGILVTFSLSIGCIYAIDWHKQKKSELSFIVMLAVLATVFFLAVILPKKLVWQGFAIDYGIFGILLPILVYYAPGKLTKLFSVAFSIVGLALTLGVDIAWYALLTIPLLALYNGERGKYKMKYVFYIFYPAHLVLIYAIAFLMAIL